MAIVLSVVTLKKDRETAVRWLKQSAEAQYEKGMNCAHEECVDAIDRDTAKTWFR